MWSLSPASSGREERRWRARSGWPFLQAMWREVSPTYADGNQHVLKLTLIAKVLQTMFLSVANTVLTSF